MLPLLLARELPRHEVTTVARSRWSGILSGDLLRLAEGAGVEVFVTADRKMEHQQRLSGRSFGVVVINAGGTKLEDLQPRAVPLRDAVARISAGEIIHLRSSR